MHVSPAKQSYAWLRRKCDYRTDPHTDRQMLDKVIPICRYASQATQTRGPKGHISCTWVQFATFLRNRPKRTLFFTDRPTKHKLGRRRWDLASYQVSLNSVQWFQRRSRKCLSQSEARAAIVFPIGPNNTNLVEDVEILLHVKIHWIPFSGFRGEVENVSANQRSGRPSCFSVRPEKHKLGRGHWDLASC